MQNDHIPKTGIRTIEKRLATIEAIALGTPVNETN
jgi:hypothetical protein